MRGPDRWSAAVVVAVLALACGSGKRSPTDQPPAPVTAELTRAQWLTVAEGFVAKPETMPRLSDPASRPRFEQLVSSPAWLRAEPSIFQGDGAELERFMIATKRLQLLLASKAASDEMLMLLLYAYEAVGSISVAGDAFVAGLRPGDREARQDGVDRMRYGAAISLCGALYLLMNASDAYRATAIAKLTSAATYAPLRRELLQLVLATLDERILPSVAPALQPSYRQIRAVVAAAYEARGAEGSPTRTTYQGIGPSTLDLAPSTTLVSVTGGFSVALGPAGIAKRVERDLPDGTTRVQHEIEWREGAATFEAICLDGHAAAELVAGFESVGFAVQASPHAGTWLTLRADGLEAWLRVMTIGGRGCAASVESPAGQVSAARAEAFLLSLQPAG